MRVTTQEKANSRPQLSALRQPLCAPCVWAILLLLWASAGGLVQGANRIAVVGGTLIDGTGAPAVPDSLILIDNGIITYSGKRGSHAASLAGARVIDAQGKFVIPGLIDMHVHYEQWMGKLFLANGVTTIKDTGNDPDWITKERDRINASPHIAAPRIIACGPVVDGTDSIWEMYSSHIAKADDEAGARKIASALVEKGVDCLKAYINLPRPAMLALIAEAHRHGLPVTGHLGHVDARQAALYGIDEIEHASGIAEASLTEDAEERAAAIQDKHHSPTGENWPVQPWEFVSPERLRSLIQLLVDRNVTIDPTLGVYDNIAHFNDQKRKENPNLKYIHFSEELRHLWIAENYFEIFGTKPWGPKEFNRALEQQDARMEFVRAFAKAGGVVVAGSDTPNPFVVPGFSLHRELELLVEAGLTPLEALQTATLNAAKTLRKETSLGTISAGRIADLVILNGDPLKDITETKNIYLVIKNGVVHDPTTLLDESNTYPLAWLQGQNPTLLATRGMPGVRRFDPPPKSLSKSRIDGRAYPGPIWPSEIAIRICSLICS